MQIEIAVIGFIQAVVVAIIGGVFVSQSNKQKDSIDRAEARDAFRVEESRLAMKLMLANVSLAVATAIAVKEGNVNGRMIAALSEAEEAENEYQNFIKSVASRQLIKGE